MLLNINIVIPIITSGIIDFCSDLSYNNFTLLQGPDEPACRLDMLEKPLSFLFL